MRAMMHSESGLAGLVLEGIAKIEDTIKKPDPAVVEKDKQIAELDKEFNETLGKLVNIENESKANNCIHKHIYFMDIKIFSFEQSGVELDQELERAQKEEVELKELVRQREAEVQRLKDVKGKNRKEFARRKKERRQKITKLT